jgi:UDP-N-acetylmuramate--alanine ligase
MAKDMSAPLPWQRVHLIGAGGVGMTGLGLILAQRGVQISGSDEAESRNLARLREHGPFAVGHAAAHLPATDLVVYSSAIPAENPELAAARARGLLCLRRGEFLAELARCFPLVVAIAGSHGKTTVTAMATQVLRAAGRQPAYLIGGDPGDGAPPAAAGAGQVLVTEVDESDTTQALMRSTYAIVTNVDDDHCWSVGGEEALRECFRTFARRSACLVTNDTPELRDLFAGHPDAIYCGAAAQAQVPPLRVPGQHNRGNAALVLAVAARLGVPLATAQAALAEFVGVQRRLTLRHEVGGVRVVEDYAHHPAEVRASLAALREQYPGGRLRVVFQPHRYERVARYAEAFSRELAAADEVVVVEPFSAWLHDAALADPRRIVAGIAGPPARYSTAPYEALAGELAESARAGDIIAIVGAGSIARLVPLMVPALTRSRKG